MFNNPYYNYNASAQNSVDRIDNQIKELENMRAQIQRTTQPAINQTFQLAPNGGIHYANSIEDVQRELVMTDSLFVTKDFTTMWFKTVKGEIKTYKLTEIVEKDEKDKLIDELNEKIRVLEGRNEQYDNTNAATETKE